MLKAFHILLLFSLLSLPFLGSSAAHAFIFVTFGDKACLEVRDGNTANRTPIQAGRCLATFPQQWKWNGFQVTGIGTSFTNRLGKCVEVAGGGTADGTPIQLFDCTGSGAQQWTYENGAIKNVRSGKCLDVGNGTPFEQVGAQARIQTCNGRFSQRWTIRSAALFSQRWTTPCDTLTFTQGPTVCLNSRSLAPGQVSASRCSVTFYDAWNWEGDKIQGIGTTQERLGGKCIDVAGGGTANGTPVRLFDCNGTGAQRWRYFKGFIMNPQSGKCLFVPYNDVDRGVLNFCSFSIEDGGITWSIQ
jgi:Ricin-type beta-trefoil lectin domain